MVYVGRNALDGATTDRFVLSKLFVSYDTELEYDMLKASLSQSDVDQVFDWVRELRLKIASYRLRRIASTRLIEQAAKAMKAGKTLDDVKARYFQDWTRDEIAKVGEAVQYA
jgi:hypothetical protein